MMDTIEEINPEEVLGNTDLDDFITQSKDVAQPATTHKVGGTASKLHNSITQNQLELLEAVLKLGYNDAGSLANDLKGNRGKRKAQGKISVETPGKKTCFSISLEDAFNQIYWLYMNPDKRFADLPDKKIIIKNWDPDFNPKRFWKTLLQYFEAVEEQKMRLSFSRDGFKVFLMYTLMTFEEKILIISNSTIKDKNALNKSKDKPILLFSDIMSKPFKSDYKIANDIRLTMQQIKNNNITVPHDPLDRLIACNPNYHNQILPENHEEDGKTEIMYTGKHEYIWITNGFAVVIGKDSIKCLSQSVNRILEKEISSKVMSLFDEESWILLEVIINQKITVLDVAAGHVKRDTETLTTENNQVFIDGKLATFEERRNWFTAHYSCIAELCQINTPNSINSLTKYDNHTKTKFNPMTRIGVLVGYTQNKLLVAYINGNNELTQLTPIDIPPILLLKESYKPTNDAKSEETTIEVNGKPIKIINSVSSFRLFKTGVKVEMIDHKFIKYADPDSEISLVYTKPQKETTTNKDSLENLFKNGDKDLLREMVKKYMADLLVEK